MICFVYLTEPFGVFGKVINKTLLLSTSIQVAYFSIKINQNNTNNYHTVLFFKEYFFRITNKKTSLEKIPKEVFVYS